MPGMGKHSDHSKWRVRAVIAVVSMIAAGLAAYSAAASYDTVSSLAVRYGLSLPRLTPIGLDGGLFGVIILNIALIWLGKPIWWLGLTSRFFAAAIIAANGAAGWPRPVGVGLRAAAPVLFVIIVEAAQYVLLYRSGEAAVERKRKRDERIPFARWLLAPFPTFVIWRRKKLWTDSRLPQSAIDTELSVIRLAEHYGPSWQQEADADLVWMIRAGVNMDEVLERVKKLTSTKVSRKPVPNPSGTGAAGKPERPPEVSTEGAAADEAARTWTDDELIAEARRLWAEHAAMGARLTQSRFELALKNSSRGGAGRQRVIDALKVVRAEAETAADDEAEAAV